MSTTENKKHFNSRRFSRVKQIPLQRNFGLRYVIVNRSSVGSNIPWILLPEIFAAPASDIRLHSHHCYCRLFLQDKWLVEFQPKYALRLSDALRHGTDGTR